MQKVVVPSTPLQVELGLLNDPLAAVEVTAKPPAPEALSILPVAQPEQVVVSSTVFAMAVSKMAHMALGVSSTVILTV